MIRSLIIPLENEMIFISSTLRRYDHNPGAFLNVHSDDLLFNRLLRLITRRYFGLDFGSVRLVRTSGVGGFLRNGRSTMYEALSLLED